MVAGVREAGLGLGAQGVRAFRPDGAVAEAGLAKAAAPDAAPEQLQIGTVMDNLRRGDDLFCREVGLVHVLDNPLGHGFRRAVQRNDLLQSAVISIDVVIEGGHIDPRDLRSFPQELGLVPARLLGPVVELEDFDGALLSLAEGEEVDKVGQRLRIVHTGAAGKDEVFEARPVRRSQGHPGQLQHMEDVGVAHLIADGEGDQVEVLHRVVALQRPKWQTVGLHSLLHVAPGREDPLAPDLGHFVHHAVENPHPHVGHADLVGVREAEGHPDPDVRLVLDDLVIFAAHISRRFLHGGQDSFQ